MQWFKHDANAHRDTKLKKLMMRYGMEGYGLYFYCLELITDSLNVNNMTFKLEDDAEIIAHDTGIHNQEVEQMMRYMVELGLFEDTNGVVTCYKIARRLDQSMSGNSKMRAVLKSLHNDGVMPESIESHDSVMQEEKRIEENRREEQDKPLRATSFPFEEIRKHWNTTRLKRINSLSDNRKKSLKARTKDITSAYPDFKGKSFLEIWEPFINFMSESDFLTGNTEAKFEASIDWVINPNNFAKILDGNYENKGDSNV